MLSEVYNGNLMGYALIFSSSNLNEQTTIKNGELSDQALLFTFKPYSFSLINISISWADGYLWDKWNEKANSLKSADNIL